MINHDHCRNRPALIFQSPRGRMVLPRFTERPSQEIRMSFYDLATVFAGMPVVDFERGEPLQNPETTCYRIRVEYESEETATDLLTAMLEEPAVDRLAGLVVGAWHGELWDADSSAIVEALVAAAPQLASLRALFLGDITMEENEVSWIKQTDLSPLWAAYPKLEHLQVRGSDGLELGEVAHDALTHLTIQCGGLPSPVLHQLADARLPSLEYLELYLGEPNYGFDGSIDDVKRLLDASFPRLTHLGLCDSEIEDEVAKAVTESPLLEQIKVLDLSLGILGDEGAEALLNCPAIARLEKLIIAHHYISEDVQKRLESLPIETEISDRQQADEYDGEVYRYIAVGE